MRIMTAGKCPIWGTAAEISEPDGCDGTHVVFSPRAGGEYFISGTATAVLGSRDEAIKARLTTWLVEQRLLGVECPDITDATVKDAERRQPLQISERAERLLKYLAAESQKIGKRVDYNVGSFDQVCAFMLAYSESVSVEEIRYLLEYLEQQDWIRDTGRSKTGGSVVVTVPGHAHLAELEEKVVDSKQAFVAMWFDGSLTAAYENGIAPAVQDAGYEPLRIDRKDHNNKIDDEIIAEIRRSRFLVADFTHGADGPRGGVYYEAGFAYGLNIPVIFTCRKDAIDKVHFDTRQYNHITWETPEELRTRLAQRISKTIGDGPLRKSG